MSSLLDARGILARHGINAAWSPNAIRVAVNARLPRSTDRKQFNGLADGCGTHTELIELAASTLHSFQNRRTPLRPPPLGEGDPLADEHTREDEEEMGDAPRSPYMVR